MGTCPLAGLARPIVGEPIWVPIPGFSTPQSQGGRRIKSKRRYKVYSSGSSSETSPVMYHKAKHLSYRLPSGSRADRIYNKYCWQYPDTPRYGLHSAVDRNYIRSRRRLVQDSAFADSSIESDSSSGDNAQLTGLRRQGAGFLNFRPEHNSRRLRRIDRILFDHL